MRQGRQVKALKDNAPDLFEVIDLEITLQVGKMTREDALSYDEYLDAHGKIWGLKRARDLLNSKEAEAEAAKQEVEAIQNNIQQIRDDQKQN